MSDPVFQATDYLSACTVLESLSTNLALQFELGDGMTWDRDTMQAHVRKRMALGIVQLMLVDEAERVAKL